MDIERHRRKPGSPYTLLFGAGAGRRSLSRELLGAPTTVPLLDLGKLCVCCNQPAESSRRLRGDAYDDYYGGHVFSAPVCHACEGHAIESSFASRMATVLIGLGALVLLLGIFMSLTVALLGLAMAGLAVAFFFGRDALTRRRARAGHYASLAFHISDGCVVVHTYNPRLAAELLERHRDVARDSPWRAKGGG